jgi:hypothetical protein
MKKPPPRNREEEVRDLWTRLVESAFDFFERAIAEHGASPKYAVLHLAASVELFLKARLMAEHWTLIIAPETDPQFDQLRNGDFESVTPAQALKRLSGVLPADAHVCKEAQCEFKSLMKERNKIAHFFHPTLHDSSPATDILQRQCRVWFHIHRLLGTVWSDIFRDSSGRLAKLNQTMKGESKFLAAVFDSIKHDLDNLKQKGSSILGCPACGFDALVVTDVDGVFKDLLCKVCDLGERVLLVDCPECHKKGVALRSGDGACECGHDFSPEELADLLHAHLPGERGHMPGSIHCPECYRDTVFELGDGYACLHCFQTFDEIGSCKWCSSFVAGGVSEDSYWIGCVLCDGNAGHIRDRDD